jgi:5-methylcytosine-specific restriction endonuclease McrA
MNIPNTQAGALEALTRRTLAHHKARAKAVGQVLDYDAGALRRLLAEHPLCAYCKAPVAWDASIDHKTPTGRGGQHCLANLAVCCKRCNGLKGQLAEGEFRELLAFLESRHPVARADLEKRLLGGGSTYAKGRTPARPAPMSVADGVAMEKARIEILKAKLARGRASDG